MPTLKQIISEQFGEKIAETIPTSFDVVGSKLIFPSFPKLPKKTEHSIGMIILSTLKHVDSVFKKTHKFSGRYRTQKLSLIAGKQSKVTEYREHNCSILLDVEKVYFSPRLGNERKRIFEKIKTNESVLVLFSGSGIYPITITKNSMAKKIVGIELNPVAHLYALANVRNNKVEGKVFLIKDDAKKQLPKLKEKFDRILMPLPKAAASFLEATLLKANKGAIIHFYCFGHEEDIPGLIKKITDACRKKRRKCAILNVVPCGHYAPYVYRYCIDFRVG